MTLPSYPARPINGGPLERARPKSGHWTYEPKLNGWRALVHAPTGQMWNRHGERLSIEDCFRPVLDLLAHADVPEWLDCEALERRLNLGRGSLVVFDYIPTGHDRITPYDKRKAKLLAALKDLPNWHPWQFGPPVQGAIYTMEGATPHEESQARELYDALQDENRALGADLYEGLVAKRINSPYPVQQRSASEETTFWVKHRWAF
jgi:ATP-dependent DNA ligase